MEHAHNSQHRHWATIAHNFIHFLYLTDMFGTVTSDIMQSGCCDILTIYQRTKSSVFMCPFLSSYLEEKISFCKLNHLIDSCFSIPQNTFQWKINCITASQHPAIVNVEQKSLGHFSCSFFFNSWHILFGSGRDYWHRTRKLVHIWVTASIEGVLFTVSVCTGTQAVRSGRERNLQHWVLWNSTISGSSPWQHAKKQTSLHPQPLQFCF